MVRWTGLGRGVVAAAMVALVGLAPVAPAQAGDGDDLSVQLSSTELREGSRITMSGSGCVDPATSSSEGLVVVLYRLEDFGRGGITAGRATVTATVAADGTFDGSGTVAQPLYPAGRQTARAYCERPVEGSAPDQLFYREVDIEVVPPALPDQQAPVGGALRIALPCTVPSWGGFEIELDRPEPTPGLLSAVLGESGVAPERGDLVDLPVPTDVAPGTYDATASCMDVDDTAAYFAGFTVTITSAPHDPAVPPGAVPTPAAPRYTG